MAETFVLLHGSWHGGWAWEPTAWCLRELGHEVYAPTYPGHHPGASRAGIRHHDYVRSVVDFIEGRDEITTQYEPGTATTVQQHDGSLLRLRKLGEEYDPSDKVAAMKRVQEGLADGEVVTGLLYLDPTPNDLHHNLNTVDAPLNTLGTADLCPGSATLDRINAGLR